MNTRTKWLALGGLVVIGFYAIDTLYRSWIEEPTQQLTAQRTALDDNLRDTRDEQQLAQKTGKRLDGYAARALPYTPQLARSAYQEWLLKLVDQHGLRSASVDAAQPVSVELKSRTKKGKRQSVGYRIAYSLRGQGTLAELSRFLSDFRTAGHLHKIRSLALTPTGREGMLDINLAIEVLSLQASPNKEQLSDWQLVAEGDTKAALDDHFVTRNLFARGFAKALLEVELKAITFDRHGSGQAWFRIDARGTTRTVNAGERVPVPLHDIVVNKVEADHVEVLLNQVPYRLSLGDSVAKASGQTIGTIEETSIVADNAAAEESQPTAAAVAD